MIQEEQQIKLLFLLTVLSEEALVLDVFHQILHGNDFLLHGVAVAYRDVAGGFGVEVHAHAEGRAGLVLAAITLADGAGLVVFAAGASPRT